MVLPEYVDKPYPAHQGYTFDRMTDLLANMDNLLTYWEEQGQLLHYEVLTIEEDEKYALIVYLRNENGNSEDTNP